MGISYDPTKPAANDKPSNDQAPMQQNFSSIKDLIDVDHVDFSNAAYGEHKQVTFASNNVPMPPVSPPILFTDTVEGLPQLKFFSGDAAHSANQYVLAGSGSTFLLGGIILKWGSYTMANGVATVPVAFANSFPNNVYSIVFGSNVSGNPNNLPIAQALTTAGFTAARVSGSSGGTFTYYYIAIGN
jgi:hypothetical protein